ncbi:MAG: asparagine synthase (glutamine-hydrolyzing) [Gammaproteobacteria bacterium]|nr:asparagine synthase (glutamine-hydrolyzing) [Gammaproteobacteria bacterium]
MCGICAIAGGHSERTSAVIEAMTRSLRHRGPDTQTYRQLPGVDLGHTRLSIIDLAGGEQPMADESGRFWIVFNGEIYNYVELRAELAREGARFHTRSDTEVILAAFAHWGAAGLQRLRGMYAFVIWDTQARRLFAARDLFGEKPLYYATAADGALVLGSEIKAIVRSGLVQPRLDRTTIDAYLCLGYVPPDRTVYENVHTLTPGHYLEWDADRGVRLTRYWKPVAAKQSWTVEDAGEQLRALLQQAVRRQMVADVPVGAFLSGGHDSSTIVALMQSESTRPVQTFSVGFGEYIDERPYARAVAERYGTDHHEIDLGAPPVAELLARMVEVYDEPFMDPSHIPTYLICEYARRHVKVALSGDGADELFGGYAWYPLLAQSVKASGAWPVWLLSRSLSRLLRDRVTTLTRYSQAQALARRWSDPWDRYVHHRFGVTRAERKALWGTDAATYFPPSYHAPDSDTHGMDRVLHFDLSCFLPGDILVKVDRAAMAHGLETRAPFLDRDVVEFALSLPAELKVKSAHTKVLFKTALQRYWPPALHNRKKQGFAAPYREWLGRPDMQALQARIFAPGSALRQLLPHIPTSIVSQRNYLAWNLLTLGLWLERHASAVAIDPPRGIGVAA